MSDDHSALVKYILSPSSAGSGSAANASTQPNGSAQVTGPTASVLGFYLAWQKELFAAIVD
jgi:hypothetical protein